MSTRILALDTTTEACSVAVWNNGEIKALYEVRPREHTQRILPLVQQVLSDAGLSLNDLDALAFGHGPGSFTGVRIAIGIAQGLALGANLPMIGISSLKTLAEQAFRRNGSTRVLAAIDARMGEVYWGEYCRDASNSWQAFSAEAVLSPEQVTQRLSDFSGAWAAAGTGWQTYPAMAEQSPIKLSNNQIVLPTAKDMLPLAIEAWQRGETTPVEGSQPVYLRNEVTWKKLPGR